MTVRVIHIFTSLDFGGVETHALTVARNAHCSNNEIYFCALGSGGAVSNELEKLGFPVYCLNCSGKIPDIEVIYNLLGLLARIKPGVVHCHGSEANFHGLISAWLCRVPVRIGEEIGIPRHSRLAKLVFKMVYVFSHRVIGISDAVRDWLVNSSEVPARKAVKIYNPVELIFTERLSSERREYDVFKVGYVGRLEEVKNPLALIRSVALLKEKNVPVKLFVVGDGSQMESCIALCSDLSLIDEVELVGYSNNPRSYVSQCDIYVQPSLSEGFGIALVEAMGCGVPVLATKVGGAPEIIDHGKTGWLVDYSDPVSLCDSLYQIWNQRENLTEIGECAKESVRGRFEPENYMVELDNLYSGLAKSGSGNG
ncbi:glycosyltransferase [Alcanivorax profundi]|uniref:glycosyltransferase n=1 Tax=Alcanivorax profundi TaxID=2338368 RepID=UPI0032B12689